MDREDLVGLVGESYDKLILLWSLHGFAQELIEKRKRSVKKYTVELFNDMILEEERRIEEKRVEVASLLSSIAKLSKDLEQEVPTIRSATLLQQVEELMSIERDLKAKKEEKMREWIQLKCVEKGLREAIGEEIENIDDFDGIPGKEDLAALQAVLNTLTQEKATRTKTYNTLKPKIKEFLTMLEKMPTNAVERTINEDKIPILSSDLLKKCKEAEAALEKEVEGNKSEAECLRDSIKDLKRRLKEEPEWDGIPDGYKPTILVLLRTEHSRLNQLKLANMTKFISELREEIATLSQEVFKVTVLPEPMEGFEATEELLSMHEKILESVKSYQQENKRALELWRKRQGVWTQWLEYEAKGDDPNRLNNRGGTLLKEEKIRKGLEKSLPKLEKEIIGLAKESPEFKIFGQEVKQLIDGEWDHFNRDKEEKKLLKKQQSGNNNNTMNVTRKRPMTPGSTTPGKRGKLTPFNKFATPTPRNGLRSAQSKDNLLVSPTYSEFTSHKQIFQSTMNEKAEKPNTPTKSRAPPKMTPREIPFNKF